MGAKSAVEAGDLRWLSPLPLWTGILGGPDCLGVRSDGELRRRQVGVSHEQLRDPAAHHDSQPGDGHRRGARSRGLR